MKKILLLFTALLLSATAMAHDVEIDGIFYNLYDYDEENTATVTYKGESYDDYSNEYSGDIVIPSTISYNGNEYIVREIESSAFDYCSVSSIFIPNSIRHIGSPYDWYGVKNINVSSDNESYSSLDGVLFNKDMTRLIYFPGGKDVEVRSYTIPDGVIYIGQYAFNQCSFLSSITIPNSVISIETRAFAGTALTSVTIPNSVNTIGGEAFWECHSLTSVIIGNKVERIGRAAFSDCNKLTSIAIPNSVKTIEEEAFSGCTSLTTFIVSSDNETYSSENGVLFNKKKTELIAYPCAKNNTSYTIPNGVKTIASSAFYECSALTSISIPNSVTSIGRDAFYGTGLWKNEENWENGVLYIGNCLVGAKEGIEGNYSIKEGTRLIAPFAFSHCQVLTSVNIPNGVIAIPDYAFYMCNSLTKVNIPNSVTSIGDEAFYWCNSLTDITIPENVTSIGRSTFGECHNLKSITWNAKNCVCDDSDYYGSIFSYQEVGQSELFNLTIGENVQHIPAGLFNGMGVCVESLTLPEGLISIARNAFTGNRFFDVIIPKSLTNIGENAFDCDINGCYYKGTVDEWVNIDFANAGANPMSHADYGNINDKSINYIEISSATTIKDYAFTNCQGIYGLKLGENITSIGEYAFANCTGIGSVSLECNLSSIEESTFSGCTNISSVHWNIKTLDDFDYNYYDEEKRGLFASAENLTAFTFGDKVEYIPAYLCKGMDKLTSLTIPNNVTAIGRGAFSGCSALTSVTLSDKLTLLNNRLFENCSSLNTVEIPNSVTFIDFRAFYACSSLESIKIPNSVTLLDENVFEDCSSLTNVELSNNITTLPWDLFSGCTSLNSIEIPSSVISIKEDAFEETGLYNNKDNWENGVLYIDNCLIQADKEVVTGEYTIKEGTRIIAENSFYECEGLTSVVIPEGLVSIDDVAFNGAKNLESFNIPSSVIYMGYGPFHETAYFVNESNWENKTDLYKDNCLLACFGANGAYSVKEGTRLIAGAALMEYIAPITSVTIPSSVRYMGPGLFGDDWNSVKNVIFKGKTVPQIFFSEEEIDMIQDGDYFDEVTLYVPCESLEDYKANEYFALFNDIKCLESEETELEQDDVVVDAGDTSVLISWPKKEGADIYTITITNNGEVICTLDFNANGQLISINFVTKRSAMAGFTFKVTGLEVSTQYAYKVVAKDADNVEVASYSGEFTTSEISTSISETFADANLSVSDGLISADADFSIYNTVGQDVTALNGALQSGIYVVAIGEDKVKVMVK